MGIKDYVVVLCIGAMVGIFSFAYEVNITQEVEEVETVKKYGYSKNCERLKIYNFGGQNVYENVYGDFSQLGDDEEAYRCDDVVIVTKKNIKVNM